MKILALELSSSRGSLAWSDGDADFSQDWPNDRQNSSEFFQNLEAVRKKFGLPDAIVVGLGPGSYAGTRIAISAGIGVARTGAKLIGYPSICAIESEENNYCVTGDARRQTFFLAQVRDNKLAEGPTLMTEAELREKLDKLDRTMSIFATEKLPQFERAQIRHPSARLLARLASDPKREFAQAPLEPIYLREPHITVPKK